jgi:hypothetical protein
VIIRLPIVAITGCSARTGLDTERGRVLSSDRA